MRIYQCGDMEAAALRLGKYHQQLVTSVYSLTRAIRLRSKLIANLKPFIYRSDVGSAGQLRRWQKDGGTLINYLAAFKRPPHDAHLICEVPMTKAWLDKLTEHTRTIAAVYRPPSWRSHREEVGRIAPPVAWCEKFAEAVRTCRLDNRQVGILDTLGIDMMGAGCLPDVELCEALGITLRQLTSVRRSTLRGKEKPPYVAVIPIVVRVPPENKGLLPMYEAIRALPSHGQVKLAQGFVLMNTALYWKSQLRSLVRCGSIELKPKLGFYWPKKVAPNYNRIGAAHDKATADVEEVISLVDSLRELPKRLPVAKGSPRPSGAPARSSSAAPARDSRG